VRSLSRRRRHPLATLVVLLLGLFVVGGLYAALAPADAAKAAPATSFQVEEGRALYLDGCSTCHGLNAEGTTDGPTLIGVGAASVDFQVGTGRMPLTRPGVQAQRKDPVYDETQTAQLAAYVASLGPGPAIPTEEQLDYEDADLAEGGEFYRTNCASCHNSSGQGGALTWGKYAPALKGLSAKHIYEAMLTGPQSMPVFSEATVTPEEKQAIIKFIKHIEEEPNPGGLSLGRIGPVSEGMVAWTFALGAMIGAAVWLGAKSS
jgi:ubiquinol-cytochrome c reductase cytochrome c subunit